MFNGFYLQVSTKAIAQQISDIISMTLAISDSAAIEFTVDIYDTI